MVRVNRVHALRTVRIAVDIHMRQQEHHRALLTGIEGDARVDGPVLRQDRRGMVIRVGDDAAR